jgi:hypothetical protein
LRPLTKALVGLFLFFLPAVLLAADWSSCQDDLDTVRRRASEASDAAAQVHQAAEELDTKRQEWQDCRAFPDIHDLLRNGCQSQRSDYASARDEYESAKGNLESELDTVDSSIGSASVSCGYSFAAGSASPRARVDPMCRLLQRYKGRVPPATLLDMCKKSRSEEDCKRCLQ